MSCPFLTLPGWAGLLEVEESLAPSPRVSPRALCYTLVALKQVAASGHFFSLQFEIQITYHVVNPCKVHS